MYNAQITVDRIKTQAKSKNITLNVLQEQCGLSKNAIQTSAKSKNGLGATYICRIAELLDCSVDYLFGLSETAKPHSFHLQEQEQILLDAYRSADAEGQMNIIYVCMDEKKKADKKKEKTSIA